MSECRACKAPVIWAKTAKGTNAPLDAAAEPGPRVKLHAFNPKTQGTVVVTAANLEDAARWAAAGVTFHEPHFFTCPFADRFRSPTT